MSATTLHFEYYAENNATPTEATSNATMTAASTIGPSNTKKISQTNLVTYIHIENVDKLGKTPAQIMNDLLKVYNVPPDRQVRYFILLMIYSESSITEISNKS